MQRDTVTLEVDAWFALGLADFLEHYDGRVLDLADVGDTCPHDSAEELERIILQLRGER